MATANPYIFFNGNAAEAMEFYKGVFGAELQTMSWESLPEGAGMEERAGLMHADLWVGDLRILASDSPPEFEQSKPTNPNICINGDDESQMRGWFDALSAGGNVEQPLEKMFWGDYFGKFTDKFGVAWMFNVSVPADGS